MEIEDKKEEKKVEKEVDKSKVSLTNLAYFALILIIALIIFMTY